VKRRLFGTPAMITNRQERLPRWTNRVWIGNRDDLRIRFRLFTHRSNRTGFVVAPRTTAGTCRVRKPKNRSPRCHRGKRFRFGCHFERPSNSGRFVNTVRFNRTAVDRTWLTRHVTVGRRTSMDEFVSIKNGNRRKRVVFERPSILQRTIRRVIFATWRPNGIILE